MKYLYSLIIFIFLTVANNNTAYAEEIPAEKLVFDINDSSKLTDRNYKTSISLNSNNKITVSTNDNSAIGGIYIIWDSAVNPWQLTVENETINCGQYGFLHEYISIDKDTSKVTINIPDGEYRISDIRVFSKGDLPSDVQQWNPPCKEADIMLIASHADDEILFFGGIIPTYIDKNNASIQVVYMSSFWDSAKIREHEKLDGLWASGLNIYPVSGGFADLYSTTIEEAAKQYDLDSMVSYITTQIRRFKPQVIVSHDFDGEYGHGFHMLTAKAVTMSIESAVDSTLYTDSATTYGIWDTPKTYFHLYKENEINLNLRIPLASMNNMTALEIAQNAYKQHVSQQWCWFFVSDENENSCARFGLYRTKVGNDLSNDLLENIKTYKVQEEESESMSIAESESIAEKESLEKASIEKASIEEQSISESISIKKDEDLQKTKTRNFFIIILLFIILAVSLTVKRAKQNR